MAVQPPDRTPDTPTGSSDADNDSDNGSVRGVPSDNTTLLEVLDALRGQGFSGSLSAEPGGTIKCSTCGRSMPTETFEPMIERRLEGASDPADELLVLAGRCGSCRAGGVLLLGYGPEASAADAEVLEQLRL